jgi:hypothetical protein
LLTSFHIFPSKKFQVRKFWNQQNMLVVGGGGGGW